MSPPAFITKLCDADLRTKDAEIHQLAGAVTVKVADEARIRRCALPTSSSGCSARSCTSSQMPEPLRRTRTAARPKRTRITVVRSTPRIVFAVIVIGMFAVALLTRCGASGEPRLIDPPTGPTVPAHEDRSDETTAVETRVLSGIDADAIAVELVASSLEPANAKKDQHSVRLLGIDTLR